MLKESKTPSQSKRIAKFSVSALLVTITPIAHADALSDLKLQLEALQAKVVELESAAGKKTAEAVREAGERLPQEQVTGGATKGSFKLPGSNTSVTLGGYVKLDALYSDRTAGAASQGNQFLNPNLIPVGPTAGDNAKSQTTFHARQSRLFVKTATPTGLGDLTTYVEGDFFGADGNETVSNSNNFRIRHAWATIGNLGAGQFWSNFMNEAALPETVDFGGPVGQLFIRQAQLRWTQKTPNGDWSFSLENPESLFALPGSATLLRADRDRFPDITARVKMTFGASTYSLAALARNIRIDSGAPMSTSASRWGGALSVTGVVPVFNHDDIRFDLNAGNAIGRYQDLGFGADGFVDANHALSLSPTLSGYAAYRHYWTPALRSSLVLSGVRENNPASTFGGINRSAHSEHLSLIWSPRQEINLGVEAIHARRVLEDDRAGNLNRIQVGAQYGF